MTQYLVGETVQYVDTKGNVKAAIITATHDTIRDFDPELEEDQIIQPAEGFAHIAIYGLSDLFHTQPRAQVPFEETAQDIPDFTIDGELVGYIRKPRL